MTPDQATAALNAAIREEGGPWEMAECVDSINDASRAIVASVHDQHGQAWLVDINPWKKECPVLWEHNPEHVVYNFSADYVLPAYDAELEQIIRQRLDTPYTSTSDDGLLVDAIMQRLEEAGAQILIWT